MSKKKEITLPRGVSIKKNRVSESLQISFTYRGISCREIMRLTPSKANIQSAANKLGAVKRDIELGAFVYAEHFPNSPSLAKFGEKLDRNKTVKDYLDEYINAAHKRGLSPSTIEGYRKVILSVKPLHSHLVTELTPAILKKYVQDSGNAPKTLQNKFSLMRTALAEAVTDGLIDHNPIDTIKLSNYVKKNNKVDEEGDHNDVIPFSPDEVNKIIQHCKDDELNIVEFVFATGLRSSEWSGLKWSDIDFELNELSVKRAIVHGKIKATKTSSGKRTVPLNEKALTCLKRQKLRSNNTEGFVFSKNLQYGEHLPNGELNRLNPDSFRKHRWSRILKDARVKYRYPYQMRHTFATKHISKGVNIWQLANWMGHSSPEMLYRHYGSFIEAYEKDKKKARLRLVHDSNVSG